MRLRSVLASLFALAASTGIARAEDHVFKIATLAPEGSSWMNHVHQWGKDVEAHSGGHVRVKLYAGGVAGDERVAVHKMRLGQLHGAAVTTIGLGVINSDVLVLQLPFFIRSYEELDYVRTRLDAELRKKFEDKGYVLVGWADLGPIHFFSNIPVQSIDDVKRTRMWIWVDDPVSRAFFTQLGASGVPLSVPDVLPSLQTGLVDACYGSPLSTLALQWYTKLKYISRFPLAFGVAAMVVVKKEFDKLSPAERAQFMVDAGQLERRLVKAVRDDNDRALKALKRAGLQVVDSPPELIEELTRQAVTVWAKVDPSLFSPDWRARVEKLVAEFRAGKR